jgi:hypothetical protein
MAIAVTFGSIIFPISSLLGWDAVAPCLRFPRKPHGEKIWRCASVKSFTVCFSLVNVIHDESLVGGRRGLTSEGLSLSWDGS